MSTTTTTPSTDVKFMSVHDFKMKVAGNSTTQIQFLERTNKETGLVTKFASINGKAFKMQGDLDITLPVSFLYTNDNINEGCFVNVKNSVTTLFSL